ncbi:MAG: PIG-L deacetylase family protein [Kofleriaceae bacterium]
MTRHVVAFGAHPDDLEVGAGGLLARLARSGEHVTMVVCSIPNRFEERLAEARAGAAQLGVTLRLLDGERLTRLEDLKMHELVVRFERVFDELSPALVITHDAHDLHWDHTLVHRATLGAVRRARCDLLAYANSPARPAGTCYADITSTIDVKLAAIAAHASQFSAASVAGRRDLARAVGQLHGVGYAEAFEPLRLLI